MATGLGVDATISNGVITSGTTATDVRKIMGSLLSPGIIGSSGLVTPSKTSLSAEVSEGVVAIPSATGEIIPAPVPRTTVNLGAPTSGTQSWTIYVQQNMPSSGGNSDIVVKATSGAVPTTNTLILDVLQISAGATTAAGAVSTYDRKYSIPYGATMGWLDGWRDTSTAPITSKSWQYYWGTTINLPTDRKVEYSISPTVSGLKPDAVTPVGNFDPNTWVEMLYKVVVDGQDFSIWNTPVLTKSWTTHYFHDYQNLFAGKHDIKFYYRLADSSTGVADRHYGGADKRPGTIIRIRDLGVIV